MTTSRNSLIITGWVLGVLTALAAAAFIGLQIVSSRSSMERMAKGVSEAVAEAQASDPRRPVIHGDAVQGRAWADYSRALALVQNPPVLEVRRWLDGAPGSDRAKALTVLAANAVTLDFLRAGARKAEGAYPTQWDKGIDTNLPSLLATRNLATLAVGQARVLREAGKPREAAELLLDAAQFGADLGRHTVLIGELGALAALGDVFEGLEKLPPDPEVGRALQVLEETFPDHGQTLRNEIVPIGVSFVQMGDRGGAVFGWRFGFSQEPMLLEAWTTLQKLVRRTAATTTMPWTEARRVNADIEVEARASGNTIVGSAIPGLVRSHQSSREALARLRMLRVLHGGATGLEDPFGGKLLSDGVKVWSIGTDGVDDGGSGAWKPASPGDIVLQIPTK